MGELEAELCEFLKVSAESVTENGRNTFTASIPNARIENILCSGKLERLDSEITQLSGKDEKEGLTGNSCLQITILDNVTCEDLHLPTRTTNAKIQEKSFVYTLSLIAKHNSEGLYRDTIRDFGQCYCSQGAFDDTQKKDASYHTTFHDVISRIHGLDADCKNLGKSDVDVVCSKDTSDAAGRLKAHTNLKAALHILTNGSKVFLISNLMSHSVEDALMYSPALLQTKTNKTLFILYQILQFFKYFEENYLLDLSSVHWDDVELDDRMWVKVQLPVESYERSFREKRVVNGEDRKDGRTTSTDRAENKDFNQLPDLMDQWISGELSNFDYLMFLNKLAGRSKNDPNHHPVLPWVSTLETGNDSWRDLTRTKYRLNKGDDQLDLQYSMMRDSANTQSRSSGNNLSQVPHHIPEFLSDITYYVYMARITSKDILCKLVRSYWEPNEYPASIQRMQAWTPDECIPEFYTDPTVFKSIHEDMVDLAVPEWCEGSEDFVKKHRAMLESEQVSSDLHHWIDLTFGYRLQGREAVEAKNVCLPLADNHTKLTNRGITQLFQCPHPKRRCKRYGQSSSIGEVIDDEPVPQLQSDFNPLEELDEVEKLLSFKIKTWGSTENTTILNNSLRNARDTRVAEGQSERAMSDRNVVAAICLMVELYLPLQTRTKTRHMTLGKRFKECVDCFFLHKHLLPSGISYAMEYFTDNLRCSMDEAVAILSDDTAVPYVSIFKTVSNRGLPPPTATILLSPYVHVLPFPLYFGDLYETIDLILAYTHHYKQPLQGEALEEVTDKLKELFEKQHDTSECLELLTPHVKQLLRQPAVHATRFLITNFEAISKAMGSKAACDNILPHILNIYASAVEQAESSRRSDTRQPFEKHETEAAKQAVSGVEKVLDSTRLTALPHSESSDSIDNMAGQRPEIIAEVTGLSEMELTGGKESSLTQPFAELYQESFLLQLNTRLGIKTFLENFPRCLADALVSYDECETEDGIVEISKRSIFWLMQRTGPTLTSKYIVRPLFRVLNRCFLMYDGSVRQSSPHKRILDCLVQAATLFGPSIITLQYLAQLSYNVSSAVNSPKFSSRNLAALKASLSAVSHFITYLTDTTLMEQLSRLSKEILIPIIDHLAKQDVNFPGGPDARKSLCLEVIHLMALVAIRIGREMSRQHLTYLFQKFFRQFSDQPVPTSTAQSNAKQQLNESADSLDVDAVVINRDMDTDAYKVGSTVVLDPSQEKHLHASWFTDSPCPSPNRGSQLAKVYASQNPDQDPSITPAQEIAATFCPEAAYCAYVSFTRLLGNIHMEKILGHDHDHIWKLSTQHEQLLRKGEEASWNSPNPHLSSSLEKPGITMVGNRIIVESQPMQKPEAKASPDEDLDIMTTLLTSSGGMETEDYLEESVRRTLQVHPSSQLTENWLAYWEHEIGLPESDGHIHFNQIELERFNGHASSVRCLCPDQSEEWFLSGSKDKTVKIWSLCRNRNSKDSKDAQAQVASCTPYFTYKGHKKTVNYVGIVEAERLVVSNDGNLHAWDPYTGQQVLSFDGADVKSGIAVATTLPSPHRYALVATNETNLRIVDFRRKLLTNEYKTTAGTSVGIVRAMCVATDGQWVAMGYSSGVVTVLDVRIGSLLSMRHAHEADISAMTAVSATRFLTASADQSVMLWEVGTNSPLAVYKSYQEPVSAIETFNDEIISASVANRVTVHSMPSESFGDGNADGRALYDKPVAVSKLRSDSFRGVLASFSVLPMKRQLLLASDNGNIKLMA